MFFVDLFMQIIKIFTFSLALSSMRRIVTGQVPNQNAGFAAGGAEGEEVNGFFLDWWGISAGEGLQRGLWRVRNFQDRASESFVQVLDRKLVAARSPTSTSLTQKRETCDLSKSLVDEGCDADMLKIRLTACAESEIWKAFNIEEFRNFRDDVVKQQLSTDCSIRQLSPTGNHLRECG